MIYYIYQTKFNYYFIMNPTNNLPNNLESKMAEIIQQTSENIHHSYDNVKQTFDKEKKDTPERHYDLDNNTTQEDHKLKVPDNILKKISNNIDENYLKKEKIYSNTHEDPDNKIHNLIKKKSSETVTLNDNLEKENTYKKQLSSK